jgi:myo-inositol-1(or 4)-monophosphatase
LSTLGKMALAERGQAAETAIREAGRLAADYFAARSNLAIVHKGAQDLVSEADRACEDLIVGQLAHAFPEDGFLGEEGGARNTDARAIWVIDPIDGTHNFLTGVPFWCVSIGLVCGGESLLGLVYHPPGDELFVARKNGGASLNGAAIHVSGESDIKRARICVGFSYRRPVADHMRGVEALLSAGCEYLRLGSGALGLAYVAAGRFDGYWERHLNSWDAAGGIALVQEAGGRTNDFWKDGGLSSGKEMLAATPGVFDVVKHLVAPDREL